MTRVNARVGRWSGMGVLALALAACGGGGGGGGDDFSVNPVPVADARSGSFIGAGADGAEYTLVLDFTARTYSMRDRGRLVGEGAFTQQGDEFFFQPGNGTGPSASSTGRFRLATDAVVGEFNAPAGAVPFVASRKFASTFAEAAGVYNLLGRQVDPATGAAIDTTIQQVQLTADRHFLVCGDATVLRIADCPAAAIVDAIVDGTGAQFLATFPGQQLGVSFHVAQVGAERILLHGDATSLPTQTFLLGLPATGSFTPGRFVGGTTEPAWGTFTLGATSFASTGTSPAGAVTARTGASGPAGSVTDIRLVQTSDAGDFFAARSAELGIVVAARGNTLAPGFVAIGKAQ